MHVAQAQAIKHNRITSATWEITQKCDWGCEHCYLGNKSLTRILGLQEIEKVLFRLADAGVLWLTLSGGEPTLHPHFWRILERARYYGFFLGLYSNLTILSPDEIDDLSRTGFESIEATILGPDADLHDRLARAPGSFEKLVSRARRLAADGSRVVLKTVLVKQNLSAKDDIRALVESLGCIYAEAWEICNRIDTCEAPSYGAVPKDEWVRFLREKVKDKDALLERRTRTEMETHYCGAGVFNWAVDPVADVYPCVIFRIKLGNLLDSDWRDIWEGPVNRAIRDTVLDVPEECEACRIQPYCKRCKAQAWMESSDYRKPSRLSCLHASITNDFVQTAFNESK